VLHLVETSGQSIRGTSLSRINLREIELKLKVDKHIKEAELYGDLKGNLIVNIELRRPIARIVQEDAPDAYVSEEGVIMGTSDKFASRVMILSGKFTKQLLEAGQLMKLDAGREIMEMIEYIDEDPFWKAQIAQMDMNAKGEIVIYPQVTGQLVEFGTPANYEEKLKKLMVFYKEILPRKGWTQYERVNLKYEGQIIAE
jgi:cell division protein FtsQ